MTGVARLVIPQAEPHITFAHFTYPALGRLLTSGSPDRVIAFGLAGPADEAIGLLLAAREDAQARLLSVHIRDADRRRGYGAALLTHFEAHVAGLEIGRIVADVPTIICGTDQPFAGHLARTGWQLGKRTGTFKSHPARIVAALSGCAERAGGGWAFEPWAMGAPDPDWAPANLAPSRFIPAAPDGRPFSRSSSMAIRGPDGIDGWIIGHDMGRGWLRVTSQALRPAGLARLWGPVIWRRYFEMVERQGWTSVSFSAADDHPSMYRLCTRRMPELCEWWGHSVELDRNLNTHAHAH